MILGLTVWSLVGGILILMSILALFFRSRLARSFYAMIPVGNMQTKVIVGAVVGLLIGGIAFFPAIWGWGTGFIQTGAIEGITQPKVITEAPSLSCVYKAGGVTTANENITFRQDNTDAQVVYVDVEDGGIPSASAVTGDIVVNITCERSGSTVEGYNALITATSKSFLSENQPTLATRYNIAVLDTHDSTVFNGQGRLQIYVNDDGGVASTTSKQEKDYITYGDNEISNDVGITVELDTTSFGELQNYSTKDVSVYNRVNGVDIPVFTIKVNKVTVA